MRMRRKHARCSKRLPEDMEQGILLAVTDYVEAYGGGWYDWGGYGGESRSERPESPRRLSPQQPWLEPWHSDLKRQYSIYNIYLTGEENGQDSKPMRSYQLLWSAEEFPDAISGPLLRDRLAVFCVPRIA